MKLRSYPDIEARVDRAAGGTVIAVVGPELYQAIRLRERMVSACRKLNYDLFRFDARELGPGDIPRMLGESSLLSPGKLILVSQVHSLGKKPSEELMQAVEHGFTDSAIFLTSSKTPRESALLKKLEKRVPFYTSYEPFQRDMSGWVSRLSSEEGIRLGRGVPVLLAEYSGRNLSRLEGALRRLALYHGKGSTIDAEGMREVLSGRDCPDVFQLGDLVFGGRRGDALLAAWSMVSNGEEPLAILTYLFGTWQKVVIATEVISEGKGKREVGQATGTGFPVLDKLMGFAEVSRRLRVHPADAAAAFEGADLGLKSGEDVLAVFGRLIFTLTRTAS